MKYKKDLQKPKRCTETVKEIAFDSKEREEYLKAQKKRRVTAKKQRLLQEQEAKRESHREKRRVRKRKQQAEAELAQRVIDTAKRGQEEERVIGDSVVTIREL